MSGKILVHHLVQSRSERIFWLLEELGVPYDVKVYARTKEGKGPKALAEAVPMGKAPAVTLPDGRMLTESGFIVHELLAAYPSAGTEAAPSADSVFWSHFAEGSLMLHLQAAFTAGKVAAGFARYRVLWLLLFFLRGVAALNDYIQGLERANLRTMLAYVEQRLGDGGGFTGAGGGNDSGDGGDGDGRLLGEGDFMMIFPLGAIAKSGGRELALGPKTEAWVQRMHARPAYARAMARMRDEEAAQVDGPAPE